MNKKTAKVAAFIEGSNLHSSIKSLENFSIDYSRLRQWIEGNGNLIRANYYTATIEDGEGHCAVTPLADWLSYNGYNVVKKKAKQFPQSGSATVQPGMKLNMPMRIKGNMDIEIAVDMMEYAPHIDHAILFSGDGDFKRVIESIQRQAVRVTVVSTMGVVADELRRQADDFIPLENLKAQLER